MGRHSCNRHKGIFTHAEHSSSWEKSLPLIEILTEANLANTALQVQKGALTTIQVAFGIQCLCL